MDSLSLRYTLTSLNLGNMATRVLRQLEPIAPLPQLTTLKSIHLCYN